MTAVRVVIVDDSPICCGVLREILEADRDIAVVAEAHDGEAALRLVERHRPDLVTVDLLMPGMHGLDVVSQIMARFPVPILVVTAAPPAEEKGHAFEAVRRGALDLVAKPSRGDRAAGEALRAEVRVLASVPVVRHIAGSSRPPRRAPSPRAPDAPPGGVVAVGIGASAGGPTALAAVLGRLPADFPAAIALVQHLPPGFARSFADFLRARTALRVIVAEGDTRILPGTVVLAPDDRHLVARDRLELTVSDAPPRMGHRPAVDVLFGSLAGALGGSAVGVLLTGMGSDGAEGLLQMRAAGALTVAQDERTSVVYGMPRAAIASGAAARILALGDVADALLAAVAARPWGAGGRPT